MPSLLSATNKAKSSFNTSGLTDTKATYKADKNGVKGFDDIKKAMAVWIQFSIGDNNKNINYFDQIVYMRSAL